MGTKTKTKTESDTAPDPAALAVVAQARAEVDAGLTVPYEQVRRWLLSWGTDKELPRPRRK